MNQKDIDRIDAIILERLPVNITASVFPYEGKYLVSLCGHMDEFESAADACTWASAFFIKAAARKRVYTGNRSNDGVD